MAHTPGPWHASDLETGEWEVVQHDATKPTPSEPWYIAVVCDAPGDGAADANARLIAAAPELLEVACALELLLRQREDELGCLSPEMEAIAVRNRAAIGKAKGGAA